MSRMMDMVPPTSYEQIEHGYLFLDWFLGKQTMGTEGKLEPAERHVRSEDELINAGKSSINPGGVPWQL